MQKRCNDEHSTSRPVTTQESHVGRKLMARSEFVYSVKRHFIFRAGHVTFCYDQTYGLVLSTLNSSDVESGITIF